ncbi:30S ribosomal protein S8 [bacterium]|nr:30S ribosomal protein S8 [bacterium]
MMMTDPIADLLTRVRNANKARHRKVDVTPTQLKISIVDLWAKAGFIKNYKLYRQSPTDKTGLLRIYLKYVGKNQPVIQGLKRVSRPSRRVYVSHSKMPKVLDGIGMAVVSTSRGVLNDKLAREHKVGGELLCTIW